MGNELLWVSSIQEDFKRIPEKDRDAIIARCEKAALNPEHFLERLKGFPYFKIKVGKYRVIVIWEKDITIYALLVDLRKKVYDRMQREDKKLQQAYAESKQSY